jgi:hypothetical protein
MAENLEGVAALVDDATDDVRAALIRTDARASTLLPLFGAVLAVVVVVIRYGLTPSAAIFVRASVAPAALAVFLLLWLVRSPEGSGAVTDDLRRYAAFVGRPSELEESFAATPPHVVRAQRLAKLSDLALRKERRVRHAVDSFMISLALLTVAAIIVLSAPA